MLTYTPQSNQPQSPSSEQPWVLLLLVFTWLWPGVFSHGLWKPLEPQVNAAIETILAGGSTWLPEVLGEPFFEVSPLYIAVATWCRTALSPWLTDAYSAARFASVLFTASGLCFAGLAGYRLLGRHHGRSVVLILIGCTGLISSGHFLNSLSVVFFGSAMSLYGYALMEKQVILSAILIGISWAILGVSAGYLLPFALMGMTLLLPFSRSWRFKRFAISLFGAFTVALPLLMVYPLALASLHPEVYSLWLNKHLWGSLGGLETFQLGFSLPYYLNNSLWFAFPAWPLACWTIFRKRWQQQRWGVLAIAWLITISLLLTLTDNRYQQNLIWLLPPLALLGAAELDTLRRGAAAFLNWFGIMAFGLFATFLWLGFFAMNFGWPAKLAERSAYFSPYYIPDFDPAPIIIAALLTPLWLSAITRRYIKGRQAVTNWAAGITLCWALMMTLFLPWFDAAKSFRPVVTQMETALPASITRGSDCISVSPDAQTARLAWQAYSTIHLKPDGQCRFALLEQPLDTALPPHTKLIWQGARPRNHQEGFALIQYTSFLSKDHYEPTYSQR